MNNDIKQDLIDEKISEKISEYVNNIVLDCPSLIKEYPILEIEYNIDGSKKDIYSLASERDIKKMQIKSDKNELDFKFSQNIISKNEYEKNINEIDEKLKRQDLLYDDLIFNIINNTTIDEIKNSILKYNLNSIDLTRLAEAINSVSENKIEEFRRNNKEFMIDKLSYWNYKYNKISKGISKAREVESFIIDLVEK